MTHIQLFATDGRFVREAKIMPCHMPPAIVTTGDGVRVFELAPDRIPGHPARYNEITSYSLDEPAVREAYPLQVKIDIDI